MPCWTVCFLQRQRGRGQVDICTLSNYADMLSRGSFLYIKDVGSTVYIYRKIRERTAFTMNSPYREVWTIPPWQVVPLPKGSRGLQRHGREEGSGIRTLKFMGLLHFVVIRIWRGRLVIHPVSPRSLWSTSHFHMGKSSPVVRIIYICVCGWVVSAYMGWSREKAPVSCYTCLPHLCCQLESGGDIYLFQRPKAMVVMQAEINCP